MIGLIFRGGGGRGGIEHWGIITFHRALRICLWAPLLALVLVLGADYAAGMVHWGLLVSSLFGVGLLSRGVGGIWGGERKSCKIGRGYWT